jgi:hypothetical protein
MKPIYQSATKIVLILLSLAVVAGLFTGIVTEETFKTALLMVLSYYFAKAQTSAEALTESGRGITDVLETLKK